jgi:hypothetical protein
MHRDADDDSAGVKSVRCWVALPMSCTMCCTSHVHLLLMLGCPVPSTQLCARHQRQYAVWCRFGQRRPFLSAVGRLDKETSGLLLLTDDGQLLHRMKSPRMSEWQVSLAAYGVPHCGCLTYYGRVLSVLSTMCDSQHRSTALTCFTYAHHSRRRRPPFVTDNTKHVQRMPGVGLVCNGLACVTECGCCLCLPPAPLHHPTFAGIWKRYRVSLDKPLVGKEAAAAVRRFASGALQLVGDRSPLLPAGLTMVDEVTAEVALCEGRYHQVGCQ